MIVHITGEKLEEYIEIDQAMKISKNQKHLKFTLRYKNDISTNKNKR